MNKLTLAQSNFDLWILLGETTHSISLERRRELNQYGIPVRQWDVLHTIQDLGPKATLAEVAKQVRRKVHVISEQTVKMEKDGLIRRIKNTPKSKLFKLELTDKGIGIIKIGKNSKTIDTIFSFLSDEERQQMESTLRRLLIRLKEINPNI